MIGVKVQRGHSLKLVKVRCTRDSTRHIFSNRVITRDQQLLDGRPLATISMGRKWGGAAVGGWVPTGSLSNNVAWAEAYLFTKWHLDPSKRSPISATAELLYSIIWVEIERLRQYILYVGVCLTYLNYVVLETYIILDMYMKLPVCADCEMFFCLGYYYLFYKIFYISASGRIRHV